MNEDKASRYHRLRRRSALLGGAWSVTLLSGLLLTGASEGLRDAAAGAAAALGAPAALSFTVLVAGWMIAVGVLHEAGAFPLACYGFLLDRKYGLSRQSFGGWLREHLKAFGVGLALGTAAGVFVYLTLHVAPDQWWWMAWGGLGASLLLLTWAAPVILLPLFFRVVPLQHADLRSRLLGLARRAGVAVVDVFEWRLGDRTSRANAMLVGVGGTRRILVSDTLVADYAADEVEAVLAHELSHHVHHDVWRALLIETTAVGAALWLGSRLLPAAVTRLGLTGVDDVAGAPVLGLAALAVSLAVLPLANALSRRAERRADAFALRATGNAEAFGRALRRLGAQHLAESSPSWMARIFFHSHPPVDERISAAQAWQARDAKAG